MKKTVLIQVLVLIAAMLSAQTTSISNYLSAPFPTGFVASKNGNLIAWVFNDKGSRNIYVADASGKNVKAVTSYSGDDGMDVGDIQLTAAGDQVIYVRGNAPNGSGEMANPAFLQVSTERFIYAVHKDGSNARKISSGAAPRISPDGRLVAFILGKQVWLASLIDTADKPIKLFQSRGSQANIQWSSDGERLAFVSNRDDHSFIGVYELKDKSVRFIEASIDMDMSPVWSPDGRQLAYLRVPNMHNLLIFTAVRESNPWSIRVCELATGKVDEVWKAAPGKGSFLFADLPSGNSLLWWGANGQMIFPYEKDGWVHLYALDAGSLQPRLLTPGNGEIENVTLATDRKTIYYTTNIDDIDRRHIWQVDVATGKTLRLTKGSDIEWSPVETANGIAYFHSSATRPAWPVALVNNVAADVAPQLFPADFATGLVQPKAVTVTASDGIKTTADIFLPPNYAANKKYPAVIFLHGGSQRQMLLGFNYGQYYSNAYGLNQYFASKGYIVLALNYRSGIGYGLNFREALNYGAGGASEVKDLLAAGLYLKNRGDVDKSKIAMWGGSYGGYLTAHGLSQAPGLFATGVDIHGVHNWNDEIPTFTPWYNYAKFPEMAKLALSSSPLVHIKNWKAPVLLIHGDDDRNVPFSESVNFAELLRKQHVHVEQLVLPDEVHSFLLHKNWLKVYEATFEFINRQMKVGEK